MRNTLGLDDDLDPSELQDALEDAFAMRFGVSEASGCRTVGDIFHVIRGHLEPAREGHGGCATALAFYRVRRALREAGLCTRLTPDTDLGGLHGLSARRLLVQLGRWSGLQVPRCRAGVPGKAGGSMVVAGLAWLLLTAMTAAPLWFAGVAAGVLGAVLACLDPGRLPCDCRTAGSLARKMAALNFGKLHASGARARGRDLWDALLGVLSEHSRLPKEDMHPGTLILQSQLRSA